MEARAVAKYIRISPTKARQVIGLIRGKDLSEATSILSYSPKAAARVISKVVDSASANAEKNHSLRRQNLYISEAYVDEGPVLKRFRARAMGRAGRIRKRTSHITVILKEKME